MARIGLGCGNIHHYATPNFGGRRESVQIIILFDVVACPSIDCWALYLQVRKEVQKKTDWRQEFDRLIVRR